MILPPAAHHLSILRQKNPTDIQFIQMRARFGQVAAIRTVNLFDVVKSRKKPEKHNNY